jgi:hypothetical protein
MSQQPISDIQFGRNVMKVLHLLCGELGIITKLIHEGVVHGLKYLLNKNDTIIRQVI